MSVYCPSNSYTHKCRRQTTKNHRLLLVSSLESRNLIFAIPFTNVIRFAFCHFAFYEPEFDIWGGKQAMPKTLFLLQFIYSFRTISLERKLPRLSKYIPSFTSSGLVEFSEGGRTLFCPSRVLMSICAWTRGTNDRLNDGMVRK